MSCQAARHILMPALQLSAQMLGLLCPGGRQLNHCFSHHISHTLEDPIEFCTVLVGGSLIKPAYLCNL